jgi:CheY-like chemotaxis protein
MHDTTHPKRILLVDDSRDEREMYAEFLRYQGYATLQADTASDAYRLAAELHPDVVVTCVKLRGQEDGLELTRRIKGDDQMRQVPVVVLSGYVMQTHTDAAAQAGCDLFVAKPCLPDALSSAIDDLLRRES